MKRFSLLTVILIISVAGPSLFISAQIKGFNRIKWEREKIAPGLKRKSSHTILNDSMPQNINIFKVNLNRREISITYNPLQNIPLSRQVTGTGALAAINGGFFDVRNGGSVTFIRTGGSTLKSEKWMRNSNINGAVLIRSGKYIYIEKAMPDLWYDDHCEYEDVLLTGPLMIKDRMTLPIPETPLAVNRHPRTAIGTRNHRKVILLTLDGRSGEALGMTILELTSLMRYLGCRNAVNLDGGGSTTAWIEGRPFNGVVNMPCDNKKFDHDGERAISNGIVIR